MRAAALTRRHKVGRTMYHVCRFASTITQAHKKGKQTSKVGAQSNHEYFRSCALAMLDATKTPAMAAWTHSPAHRLLAAGLSKLQCCM